MPKRILMLHGLAQTGEYFSSKTKNFRIELEKLGYSLYYPTAPNKYSAADLPEEIGSADSSTNESHEVTAWIEDDLINESYNLPQTTITFLHDYVIENGPFEGIIGFSQGAGVAGFLVTDFNKLLGLTKEEQPPLKFFMSFSGFRFRPDKYQEQYDNHPISIPSLHVRGDLDTITSSAKVDALYNSCNVENRTKMIHKGGHYVPTSRGVIKKMIDWLQAVNKY
ncbi:hypothetical protein TBLA_0D01080 [Henningerozyma blattae CBS 6284]|uniref:Serine hydrolase domain-containing protein n=1 Tax=Henningerozyma blattae (strain ATCC 34711 / CBS 6284 / DSM 70876 / NBRC 10599 / NRRL Y-10934 / UCD 77-7) TaxID=1071380 RepID=I2H2L4_HENB6|nr:hypothetical protein TBLA_0D01080 [Tetrapisispora blattae CBS 6284]CCH60616.1 hypothetical protein TBLA_0D01080 [Tetrapisispora blattae CBS 6284]